jgi:hypothetical protein
MKSPLIKSLLGSAAIAAAVILLPMAGANAACWTDGWGWQCQPGYPGAGYPGYGFAPAPMMGPGWGYGFRGDYNQIPNDYPGPAPAGDNND